MKWPAYPLAERYREGQPERSPPQGQAWLLEHKVALPVAAYASHLQFKLSEIQWLDDRDATPENSNSGLVPTELEGTSRRTARPEEVWSALEITSS